VLVLDQEHDGCRFRHELLREAVYAAVLPGERRRLHRRLASVLQADESRDRRGPGHRAAELASHWWAAEAWAEAVEPSVAAADAAVEVWAFVESQALPDMSYAGFAESLGLGAQSVTDPDELEDAWSMALSSDRPHLLDVHTDADVPPIPPHATLDQMTSMAKALIKGDPSRWGVMKEGMKTKAQELLPHHD